MSVDTSNSGSSNSTLSPTCLNQLVSSPSVTVSPSLGIVTNHSSFDMQRLPFPLEIPFPLEVRQPCSERPEKVIMVSPIASERLGWAWISRPTSLGNASQLTAR